MSHGSDSEFEPIPGLPEELPEGERVIWQGRPDWRALARSVFKLKWLAIYFAVFACMRTAMAIFDGEGAMGAVEVVKVVVLSCAGLGILAGIAMLQARSAVYTITNRRVVMRVGVALPIAWNIPFKRLASADMTERKEGDGDIVLTLSGKDSIGWVFLWPHVQPMKVSSARPAFRAIADPKRIAGILQGAVKEWSKEAATPLAITSTKATEATEVVEVTARPAVPVGAGLAEAGR